MPTDQKTALNYTEIGRRIIVALDLSNAERAREVVRELGDRPAAYKVGLQLFTSAGPSFVKELTDKGSRLFLDLKFHDIPNTVAAACIEAANLNVWMMNVHSLGGAEMMKRAFSDVSEHCLRSNMPRPLMIGVSILTSSDGSTTKEVGLQGTVEEQVLRLARLVELSGLDGVVASPIEAAAIRKTINKKDFLIVTPGIRASNATNYDQKRVTTVRSALANGSDYLVIGRPITQASDMLGAFEELTTE